MAETWESNEILLGYLLAFVRMSPFLLRVVLSLPKAGISFDLG